MHHTIESLIQACQSAISGTDNPHTVVQVAGFGTLIQRLDSTHVFLETARTFLADKGTTVADRVAAKVVPMFMKIEDADTIESRQEAWNALYMYISALNFVSVSDVHRVHTRMEEVLVGIDDDWSDLRSFAAEMQRAYPIAIDDATIDFVKATLGELIQDEESESEEVLNLYILNRLKGHIPAQYNLDEEEDAEVPVQVLDFMAQAASSPGAVLKKHFEFEHSTLFSLLKDSQPVKMIVKGDHSATAFVDGVPVPATQVADGVHWAFQKGVWRFVIDGAPYTIAMKQ